MADEPGDPSYITNLLSAEVDHNCYFFVGDPTSGEAERIGVVPAMLMAHSLVLRRVLSPQETELSERWDINLPHVTPRTFKHLLKFAYGYNNIKSYTVKETLDLLKVADSFVMHPMIVEASKHIVNVMTPSNICEILQEQVCLDYKKLEQEISKMIKTKTVEVFSSDNFHMISPASMRYILMLEDKLQLTQIGVWRAVIKWARRKVLREMPPANSRLEKLSQPMLIVPCLRHNRLCLFNLIAIVEEALSRGKPAKDFYSLISTYHYVATNSPVNTVSVCNVDKGGKTIVHNSYDVKVIYNCSFWTDPELRNSSELVINTPNCAVTLHAIVCTGLAKRTGDVEDWFRKMELTDECALYESKCTVRTTLTTDTEKTEISKVSFYEHMVFDEEFQIPLCPNGKMLRLEPNSKYILETNFSMPHPLWYTNDIDYFRPNESEDLVVGCGFINENKMWYGSHVKFLLYKKDSTSDL